MCKEIFVKCKYKIVNFFFSVRFILKSIFVNLNIEKRGIFFIWIFFCWRIFLIIVFLYFGNFVVILEIIWFSLWFNILLYFDIERLYCFIFLYIVFFDIFNIWEILMILNLDFSKKFNIFFGIKYLEFFCIKRLFLWWI